MSSPDGDRDRPPKPEGNPEQSGLWALKAALPQKKKGVRVAPDPAAGPTTQSPAEELLSGALSAALDAVIVIDASDVILEFNPAACQVFGCTREEALGRDLAELVIPPAVRERHRVALARHVATGERRILDRRIELEAQRVNGETFPAELTVTRMPGRTPRFVAFIRDLSERRAMEAAIAEAELRFRELIEQVKDYAIFLMDPDRRAISWNEGVARILGFSEAEFIGIDVSRAIFPPEDVAAGVAEREFETAEKMGTASDDRWMVRKDGTRFFALGVTLARRRANGDLLGFAKIMRDRTDQKRLELELRETAEELAVANGRQKAFLAVLSHELRNPLAPIRNGVGILRMAGVSAANSATVLDMLDRQVGHLVKLIDELLDMTRINSGKIILRREIVDLLPALRQAVEITEAQCHDPAPRMDVRLPSEPLWVDADPTRLVQIVSNLLHNACKFTPAGGRIEMAADREGAEAVVTIRDTGIGIQEEHLKRIFEMFQQIETPAGVQSGLGIGLALTRTLIELHGGSIRASSAGVGAGSEFEVRLPLARGPAAG